MTVEQRLERLELALAQLTAASARQFSGEGLWESLFGPGHVQPAIKGVSALSAIYNEHLEEDR
jgi:hypothetical protein